MTDITDSELRALVPAQRGATWTPDLFIQARALIEQWHLPPQGLTLLTTKGGVRIYTNHVGLVWILHEEAPTRGGLKRLTSEILPLEPGYNGPGYSRARATVEYGDGAIYQAESICTQQGDSFNEAFKRAGMAQTRALNRAIRLATRCAISSAEELDEMPLGLTTVTEVRSNG